MNSNVCVVVGSDNIFPENEVLEDFIKNKLNDFVKENKIKTFLFPKFDVFETIFLKYYETINCKVPLAFLNLCMIPPNFYGNYQTNLDFCLTNYTIFLTMINWLSPDEYKFKKKAIDKNLQLMEIK